MISGDNMQNQMIYILENNSALSETGYKVMKNHENIGLLPCNYVYYNGKIKLIYKKGELVDLGEIISNINSDQYMEIMKNLFDLLINIRDIGFLQFRNVLMKLKDIYVNPNNYKVGLIYFPLNVEKDIDFKELEKNTIDELRKINFYYNNLNSPKYQAFVEILNKNYSIEVIKKEMQSLQSKGNSYNIQNQLVRNEAFTERTSLQQVEVPQNTEVNVKKERFGLFGRKKKEKNNDQTIFKVRLEGGATQILEDEFEPKICLRYMGNDNQLEILINKSEYLLGKQEDAVDFALSMSKAVSRVHCKIISVNDIVYIEDLKSSNGTFVNGRRLIGNERMPLGQGDKVKIANLEFAVIRV